MHLFKKSFSGPYKSSVIADTKIWPRDFSKQFCNTSPLLTSPLWIFLKALQLMLFRHWKLTVEKTLARTSFTFLFTLLSLSHSAHIFLSLGAPAGWSKTRCYRHVILTYQHTPFLTYTTASFFSNNSGPHFPFFWGMLSWSGIVLGCPCCIHGENANSDDEATSPGSAAEPASD